MFRPLLLSSKERIYSRGPDHVKAESVLYPPSRVERSCRAQAAKVSCRAMNAEPGDRAERRGEQQGREYLPTRGDQAQGDKEAEEAIEGTLSLCRKWRTAEC